MRPGPRSAQRWRSRAKPSTAPTRPPGTHSSGLLLQLDEVFRRAPQALSQEVVVMAPDVLVPRELKSLQDELATSQKQRATLSAAAVTAPMTAPESPKETQDEGEV